MENTRLFRRFIDISISDKALNLNLIGVTRALNYSGVPKLHSFVLPFLEVSSFDISLSFFIMKNID